MTSGTKKLAQKAVAVVVIVILLDVVAGVSPVVMMFVSGIVFVVWVVSRRSQTREVERLFEFYLATEAILREEDRRWYGFEVAEVIENGECLLEELPDPPPLHMFALGALYHRLGNHQATVEYLSRIVEDEQYDERYRTAASPQLRRYVSLLRRIEHEPSIAPQTLGAVRSLERARRKHAAEMLAESRRFLRVEKSAEAAVTTSEVLPDAPAELTSADSRSFASISAPPPITEVLQDIYDDNTANN
jgi:hypothetical protein